MLNDLGADTSLKTSVKKRKPENMLEWNLDDVLDQGSTYRLVRVSVKVFLLAHQLAKSGAWIPVLDTYPDLLEFFNSMSRQGRVIILPDPSWRHIIGTLSLKLRNLKRICLDLTKILSDLVPVMGTCNEEFWRVHYWSRTGEDNIRAWSPFCKLLNPKRRWLNEGWTDNFIDCFIGIGALLISFHDLKLILKDPTVWWHFAWW